MQDFFLEEFPCLTLSGPSGSSNTTRCRVSGRRTPEISFWRAAPGSKSITTRYRRTFCQTLQDLQPTRKSAQICRGSRVSSQRLPRTCLSVTVMISNFGRVTSSGRGLQRFQLDSPSDVRAHSDRMTEYDSYCPRRTDLDNIYAKGFAFSHPIICILSSP